MTFPAPDSDTRNRTSPLRMIPPRRSVRIALLGAVAVAAIGGTIANYTFVAPAANAATTDAQAPMAGPASFANVIDRVRGAVVSVKVKVVESADNTQTPGMPQLQPGDPMERFLHRFGGDNLPFSGQQRPRTGQALGSGFIISSDGYVVTNNHVVENATDVTVTMDDGKTMPATVVGTDKKTDLALLKIKDGGNFPYVDFASQTPHVGDWVIAVGNPFGLGGTVTAGIVSARGRDIGAGPYDDYLQIDAPVNRGNSGGPSFNMQGQVVGVNTAIYSPSGGSVGIGFAIPAEVAKNVVNSLKDKGSVVRGWIGVQIQPVSADIADSIGMKGTDGALVADTQANSPAAAAGIKAGDVITAVNGDKVKDPRELARKIAGIAPDQKIVLTYVHDGSEKTASITLGTLPNDQQASAEQSSRNGNEPSSLSGLGLTLAPAASVSGAGQQGVVVTNVDPNGVAAQKGLRSGDVILEAAGHAVSRPSEISTAMTTAKKDGHKAILLQVKSGDNTHFVALAMNPAS